MAMPHATPVQGHWTVEDVWALPEDGQRYEVIDGVLYVTPAPRGLHQNAAGLLFELLAPFVRRQRLGATLWSPADIRYDVRTMVQPDVFVTPLVDGRRPRDWSEIRHLLLVVEVLSPSTARRDRGVKRRLYQQHADEYWIVDLDGRVVERWVPGVDRPEIIARILVWTPPGAVEPLAIDLPAVFREAWGDPA